MTFPRKEIFLITALSLFFIIILSVPTSAMGKREHKNKNAEKPTKEHSTSSTESATGHESAQWGFFELSNVNDPLRGLSDVKWTRRTGLFWSRIEENPGSGKYNWELMDNYVKAAQKSNVNMIFVIKTGNHPKATDSDCYRAAREKKTDKTELHSCPVTEKYKNAYKKLIGSIVERYDGDGKSDMSGLKKSFQLDIQIENEAADRAYWYYNETVNGKRAALEYINLLKLAYEAKELANPGTKIILPGMIRPHKIARCLAGSSDKDCDQSFHKRVRDFTIETLKHPEYFDAIDIHLFNYFRFDPTFIKDSLVWLKSEMKKNGYSKPIYSLEWTSTMMMMVMNEGHAKEFMATYPHKIKGNKSAQKKIYQNLGKKENKAHRDYFESEQAREFPKLMTTMLVNGVERFVHVKFKDYVGKGWNSLWWNWQGIVRYEGTRKSPKLIKKPSYHTFKILSDRIHGYTSYKILKEKTIYAYQFNFNDKKPVVIAWTEGEPKSFNGSKMFKGSDILVSYFVESLDKDNKPVRKSSIAVSSKEIPLSGSPIMIEPAGH